MGKMTKKIQAHPQGALWCISCLHSS